MIAMTIATKWIGHRRKNQSPSLLACGSKSLHSIPLAWSDIILLLPRSPFPGQPTHLPTSYFFLNPSTPTRLTTIQYPTTANPDTCSLLQGRIISYPPTTEHAHILKNDTWKIRPYLQPFPVIASSLLNSPPLANTLMCIRPPPRCH